MIKRKKMTKHSRKLRRTERKRGEGLRVKLTLQDLAQPIEQAYKTWMGRNPGGTPEEFAKDFADTMESIGGTINRLEAMGNANTN